MERPPSPGCPYELVPELACARMSFFQKEVAEVCSRISTKASEDEKIGMMENILPTWH